MLSLSETAESIIDYNLIDEAYIAVTSSIIEIYNLNETDVFSLSASAALVTTASPGIVLAGSDAVLTSFTFPNGSEFSNALLLEGSAGDDIFSIGGDFNPSQSVGIIFGGEGQDTLVLGRGLGDETVIAGTLLESIEFTLLDERDVLVVLPSQLADLGQVSFFNADDGVSEIRLAAPVSTEVVNFSAFEFKDGQSLEITSSPGFTGGELFLNLSLTNILGGGAVTDDPLITFRGSNANDTVTGSSAVDHLFGEAGDDLLVANNSGTGSIGDLLDGGDGDDQLLGSGGADTLIDVDGNNFIDANDGDDIITAAGAGTTVQADEGDDIISLALSLVGGSVSGGTGQDELRFIAEGGFFQETVFTGIERTILGAPTSDDDPDALDALVINADQIQNLGTIELANGQQVANIILSNAGSAEMPALADFNSLILDQPEEILNVIVATLTVPGDVLTVDFSSASIAPGARIIFSGEESNDTVLGSAASDTLSGGFGDDVITGNDGDDRLDGGEGDDIIRGGLGADVITDQAGLQDIDGAEGDDIITVTGGGTVLGGTGNDLVTVNGFFTDGVLDGGAGDNDILRITAASDLAGTAITGFETLEIDAETITIEADFFSFFENIAVLGGAGETVLNINNPNLVPIDFSGLSVSDGRTLVLNIAAPFNPATGLPGDAIIDLVLGLADANLGPGSRIVVNASGANESIIASATPDGAGVVINAGPGIDLTTGTEGDDVITDFGGSFDIDALGGNDQISVGVAGTVLVDTNINAVEQFPFGLVNAGAGDDVITASGAFQFANFNGQAGNDILQLDGAGFVGLTTSSIEEIVILGEADNVLPGVFVTAASVAGQPTVSISGGDTQASVTLGLFGSLPQISPQDFTDNIAAFLSPAFDPATTLVFDNLVLDNNQSITFQSLGGGTNERVFLDFSGASISGNGRIAYEGSTDSAFIIGTAGDDTFTSGDDSLQFFADGGDGNDVLTFAEDGSPFQLSEFVGGGVLTPFAELFGGEGDDTLEIQRDNAILDGGAGNDTIIDSRTGFIPNIQFADDTQLIGGAGDDDFILENAGSRSVVPSANTAILGGTGSDDLFLDNSSSVFLSAFTFDSVERLVLQGNGSIFLDVNQLADFTSIELAPGVEAVNIINVLASDLGSQSFIFRPGDTIEDLRETFSPEGTQTLVSDITGTNSADVLEITTLSGTVTAGAGNDTIIATRPPSLAVDAGFDLGLFGQEGDDTFIFERGNTGTTGASSGSFVINGGSGFDEVIVRNDGFVNLNGGSESGSPFIDIERLTFLNDAPVALNLDLIASVDEIVLPSGVTDILFIIEGGSVVTSAVFTDEDTPESFLERLATEGPDQVDDGGPFTGVFDSTVAANGPFNSTFTFNRFTNGVVSPGGGTDLVRFFGQDFGFNINGSTAEFDAVSTTADVRGTLFDTTGNGISSTLLQDLDRVIIDADQLLNLGEITSVTDFIAQDPADFSFSLTNINGRQVDFQRADGSDILVLGAGQDLIVRTNAEARAGDQSVVDASKLTFGEGAGFTFIGGDGDDTAIGNSTDDSFTDFFGSNTIFAEAGNDTITVRTTSNLNAIDAPGSFIDAGDGNDTITASITLLNSIVTGGAGDDDRLTLTGETQTSSVNLTGTLFTNNPNTNDGLEQTFITGSNRNVIIDAGQLSNLGVISSDSNGFEFTLVNIDGEVVTLQDLDGNNLLNLLPGDDLTIQNATGNPSSNPTVAQSGQQVTVDVSAVPFVDGSRFFFGSAGNSSLSDDTVISGAGDDEIRVEAGNDTVFGGDGDDDIRLGTGDDFADGGDGDDLITFTGNNIVFGGAGNDFIQANTPGGGGLNLLFGGDGNDSISPFGVQQAGSILEGGLGDDTINPLNGVVNGTIAGDFVDNPNAEPDSFDRLLIFQTVNSATQTDVNLTGTTISGIETTIFRQNSRGLIVDADQLNNLGEVDIGDPIATSIPLATLADFFIANAANQTVDFFNLNVLDGEVAEFTLSGTTSTFPNGGQLVAGQAFTLDLSNATFEGSGHIVFNGSQGNETILSGSGDDILVGSSGDDVLDGGAGNDDIRGDGGLDTLIGGAGNDILRPGTGDQVFAGAGDDIITAGFMDGIIDGGEGFDRLNLGVLSNPSTGASVLGTTLLGLEETQILSIGFGGNAGGFDFEPFQIAQLGRIFLNEAVPEAFINLVNVDNQFANFSNLEVGENQRVIVGLENPDGGPDGNQGSLAGISLTLDFSTATIAPTGVIEYQGTTINETVIGSEGADIISLFTGSDTVQAGGGDDIIDFGSGTGGEVDFIDAGAGDDIVNYSGGNFTDRLEVRLGAGDDIFNAFGTAEFGLVEGSLDFNVFNAGEGPFGFDGGGTVFNNFNETNLTQNLSFQFDASQIINLGDLSITGTGDAAIELTFFNNEIADFGRLTLADGQTLTVNLTTVNRFGSSSNTTIQNDLNSTVDFSGATIGVGAQVVFEGLASADTVIASSAADRFSGDNIGQSANPSGVTASDTISYAASTGLVRVDLSDVTPVSFGTGTIEFQSVEGGFAEDDLIDGFENIVGSDLFTTGDFEAGFADVLVGDDVNNIITGLGGDDLITTNEGFDIIVATADNGDDLVLDFEDGFDRVDLRPLSPEAGIAAFDGAFSAIVDGVESTIIPLPLSGGSVTLLGLAFEDFEISDVILVDELDARDDFVLASDTLITSGSILDANSNGSQIGFPDTGTVEIVTSEDVDLIVTGFRVNGSGVTQVPGTTFDLPSGATFTLNQDGTFIYDPNGSETLTALAVGEEFEEVVIEYTLSDGFDLQDTAEVFITVVGTNSAPESTGPIFVTLSEDDSLTSIDLVQNIFDIDGDTDFTISGFPVGLGDGFSLGGTALFVDPSSNNDLQTLDDGESTDTVPFPFPLSFAFDVSDPSGDTTLQELFITIIGANDAPVAQDDSFTTDEDTPILNFDVIQNDSDIEDDELFLTAINGQSLNLGQTISLSQGGQITLNTDGTLSFDPLDDFQSLGQSEIFTFGVVQTISDGTDTDLAPLSITITGVLDVPTATVAFSDNGVVNEGDILSVDITDFDNPDQLTITQVALVENGNVLTSVANPDFIDTVSLASVFDDGDDVANLIVEITIEDGSSFELGSAIIDILDVAPIADVGTTTPIVFEGDQAIVNITNFFDPGVDTVSQLRLVDINDFNTVLATINNPNTNIPQAFTFTAPDAGPVPTVLNLTVLAENEDGIFNLGPVDITVQDAPPTAIVDIPDVIDEADTVFVTITDFNDPGNAINPDADMVTSLQFLDQDGNILQDFANPDFSIGFNSFEITNDAIFADGGPDNVNPTITVRVINDDGIFDLSTQTVQINDVAPVTTFSLPPVVSVGQTVPVTVVLPEIDPGQDTVSSIIVDFGDGGALETVPVINTLVPQIVEDVFTQTGTFEVEVFLQNEDGIFSQGTQEILVADPLSIVAGPDRISTEGQSIFQTIFLSDTIDDGVPGRTYEVDFENDGITDLTGNLDFSVTSFVVEIPTPDGGPFDPLQEVVVTVLDGSDVLSDSFTIDVADVAPTAPVTLPSTIVQGDMLEILIGAVSDPGLDTVTNVLVEVQGGILNDTFLFDFGDPITNSTLNSLPIGTFDITVALINEDTTVAMGGFEIFSGPLQVIAPPSTLEVFAGFDAVVDEGTTLVRTITLADGADNDSDNDGSGNDGRIATIDLDNDGIADFVDFNNDGMLENQLLLGAGQFSFDVVIDAPDGGPAQPPQLITITVEDGDNETAQDDFILTIDNVAPTADISGPEQVFEAETITISVSNFQDPGLDTVSQIRLLEDGIELLSVDDPNLNGTFTFAPIDAGDGFNLRNFAVEVTDEDGTFDLGLVNVQVLDLVPTADLVFPAETDEGSQFTVELSNFVDPGNDEVTGIFLIDENGNTIGPVNLTDPFNATGPIELIGTLPDGDLTDVDVSVVVTSGGQNITIGSGLVDVNNVAPTATVSGNATVPVNQPYNVILGTIIDPGDDQVTDVFVDFGDGQGFQQFDFGNALTNVFTETGIFTINVDIQDEDGRFSLNPLIVEVVEPEITVDTISDFIVLEGSFVSTTVNISDGEDNGDLGRDIFIDFTNPLFGDISFNNFTGLAVPIILPTEDGDLTTSVIVTVTDTPTEVVTTSFNLTVLDVPPTGIISATPIVTVGETVTVVIEELNDPGQDTVSDILVSFGDGGPIEIFSPGDPITTTFDTVGEFTVSLSVVNEDTDILNPFFIDTAIVEVIDDAAASPPPADTINLIFGTENQDILFGTSGADAINSLGGANDVVTGGLGDDIFVFNAVNGRFEIDEILDFQIGEDLIDLQSAGRSVIASGIANGNTIIVLDGDFDQIILRDVEIDAANLASTFLVV